MNCIDEKFKEKRPEETVQYILEILDKLGISLTEQWFESGVRNCYSLRVALKNTCIGANGKGVTPEFARASAYAEFMERLQSGLLLYSFQSLGYNKSLFLHNYAPDAVYMPAKEIAAQTWTKELSKKHSYAGSITEQDIVRLCIRLSESSQILTLPFKNLTTGECHMIPAVMIDYIYSSNGCCAGNTTNEALVHGLSEIIERWATTELITKGLVPPEIPCDSLSEFSYAYETIKNIEAAGRYNVKIRDCSLGSGIPVLAAVITDRHLHSYHVTIAADPIFELALERCLTETMQGREIGSISSQTKILETFSDISLNYNLVNQLETGNGIFPLSFFNPKEKTLPSDFKDRSKYCNDELLSELIQVIENMGHNILIRNYSYLGFPTYKIIVPRLSEAWDFRLSPSYPDSEFPPLIAKALRNITSAPDAILRNIHWYTNYAAGYLCSGESFTSLAGIPLLLSPAEDRTLLMRHLIYVSLKTGMHTSLPNLFNRFSPQIPEAEVINCIMMCLNLSADTRDISRCKKVLRLFYTNDIIDESLKIMNYGATNQSLLSCDFSNCDNCLYKKCCGFNEMKNLIKIIGPIYSVS